MLRNNPTIIGSRLTHAFFPRSGMLSGRYSHKRKMSAFVPVLICFSLAFVLAGVATITTFRLVPIGCVLEKTLLEQSRVNANQDGYTYTVQIQGLYNPAHFCGEMRAWMRVDIPPLKILPRDTLSVLELSLWDGNRRIAALPSGIQTYPAHPHGYSVILATAWGNAFCGRLQTVNNTTWSSGIIMTDSVCAEH
ncbi:MAG TPA: hypothetical protein VKR06_01370 [Ktedonosporobacter sp.]|nr:hypothetical protein [Ktedonosporobacter sp.]